MPLVWLGVAVALPAVIGVGGVLAAILLGLVPVITAPVWSRGGKLVQDGLDLLFRHGLLREGLAIDIVIGVGTALFLQALAFALCMACCDDVALALVGAAVPGMVAWVLFLLSPFASFFSVLVFLVKLFAVLVVMAVAVTTRVTFADLWSKYPHDFRLALGWAAVQFVLDMLFFMVVTGSPNFRTRRVDAKAD